MHRLAGVALLLLSILLILLALVVVVVLLLLVVVLLVISTIHIGNLHYHYIISRTIHAHGR